MKLCKGFVLKNKFIITISDIHGVKQYTLHQFIRVIALWIVLGVIVVFTVGAIILNSLSDEVDEYAVYTQMLKNTKETLIEENSKLQSSIFGKTQELDSMNQHLSEIEVMIGIKPDINNILQDSKHDISKQIEKIKLTATQINILNKSIPNGLPIDYKRVSDGFGYRMHPILKRKEFHAGMDLTAKSGTPIYAPADGVVEYAKKKGSYGNYLLLNHPYGFKTAYGHLKKFAVKEGDYISKGDLVGYVGNTGRSTGPHLHYEIRYLQKWLDPKNFKELSPQNYSKIMKKESFIEWDSLMAQIFRQIREIKKNN